MQTQNKLFDDLARVANGAVSTLTGMKDEIDAMIRQRLERYLSNADLVTREEFDAVKTMAQKARTENEKLEARVKALEAELAKPARKATTKKKAAAKPKTASRAGSDKKSATPKCPDQNPTKSM